MNTVAEKLKNREPYITLTVPAGMDAKRYVENQLLSSPYALSIISGYTMLQAGLPGMDRAVTLAVRYETENCTGAVCCVKDMFELTTAVSMFLRCHMKETVIVVDNRSGFIPKNGIASRIRACREYVGEELEIHQHSASRSSWKNFSDNRILVYTLKMDYFDSAKDINDLSCILAEQADRIRQESGGDPQRMVNLLLTWFRENVEYRDTSERSDHSAVGLYKSGTAVCQGIAAYAYKLLTCCGLDARYVSGEGIGMSGWGPHGWNMVKLNGIWHNIDYTFELKSRRKSVIRDERFFERDHRWDKTRYSAARSDELANVRKTLNASVMILLPEENCISVNGCVMDFSASHRICVVADGNIRVSFTDMVSLYGGCCQLKGDSMFLYLGTKRHVIPFSAFHHENGAWYLDVLWLKQCGFRVSVENGAVVVQNQNG